MIMGEVKRIWYNHKSKKYVTSELFTCERTNLVFDTETKIVYYQINNATYGYMTPYISANGKYCRFVDEQIVEIG